MNVRNRWFLLFTALISVALIAAVACGGTSSSDKTATANAGGGGGKTPAATSATTGGDKAPAEQQKITIQSGEPQYLDPFRSSFEQDIAIERMIFRGLYNLTDDGKGGVKVEPAMAAAEPKIDGNVYTVTLKDGLKWSDGQPLTAQNFVDGAKRGCDPEVATDYGYLWGEGYIDLKGCADLQAAFAGDSPPDAAGKQALVDALGVRAIDDKTVEYTLAKPNGRFTTIMSLWVTFPARQDVIDQYGEAWTQPGNIVSNGPFMLKSYTAGDNLVLVPDPNWTGDEPALQEITVKFLDDLSAGFRAYQSGELDMTRINASDVTTAESAGLKDEVVIDPTARITWLEMQLKDPVLSKFEVRLAMSRAIDREALVDAVSDGIFTPANYWVVKGLVGFQGNEPFEGTIGYDEAAAKKALADAGYPDGAGFPELGVIVNTPERIAAAEFLQQQYKKVLGINIRIDQVDSPTRSAAFRNETFQLLIGGWQIDYPDIENVLFGLFETGAGNNHYSCSNPDVDAALQRALSATSEDARIKAYQDMETAVVLNLCGGVPLWQDAVPYLVNSSIGGVVANGAIDAGQPGNYCAECWYVKK